MAEKIHNNTLKSSMMVRAALLVVYIDLITETTRAKTIILTISLRRKTGKATTSPSNRAKLERKEGFKNPEGKFLIIKCSECPR